MSALPPLLDEHFRRPRCAGAMEDASASGRGANAACGDDLRLFLKIDAGRIERASFQARACSAVIAVGSLVAEALCGATLEAARVLSCRDLVDRAGGLPRERTHAAEVAERALREALSGLERTGPDGCAH